MTKIFNNTEVAFALKTDTELDRAYFLFKMIANEPLVRIGTAVTNFALKAHLPVEGLIRATVFDHFCGGTTEDDCLTVVDKMFTKGVSSVLDYSVEGKEEEEQFDAALEMTLKTIEFARERLAIPFAVFKPTGFGRFYLYEKLGEKQSLTPEEQAEWNRVVERFDIVCKTAHEKDVALLIDGEESWMQDAADDLVTDMMRKYNKEKAIVFNTLQLTEGSRAVLRGEVSVLLRESVSQKAEKRSRKSQAPGPAAANLSQEALVRYINLKAWRAEVAKEHNLPAYVIFHDATLALIASAAPQTLNDLNGISGIGAKKLEAYGQEVLQVCRVQLK